MLKEPHENHNQIVTTIDGTKLSANKVNDETFVIIPDYSNYCINKKGEIKSLIPNIRVNVFETSGYRFARLFKDNRQSLRKRSISKLVWHTFVDNTCDACGFVLTYLDQNTLNCHLINLIRHTTILQHEDPDMSGYRVIFNHSRYCINNEGKIWDKLKQEHVKIHHGKRGHHLVWLTSDDQEVYSQQVHRLLGLAYLPIPENVNSKIINHKDGNPANNFVDIDNIEGDKTNIEWCTHSYNIKHAIDNGLNPIGHSVQAKNLTTGEITHYMTLSRVQNALGIKVATLSYNFVNNNGYYYAKDKGYLLRRLTDGITEHSPWDYDINTSYDKRNIESFGGIKVYDINTENEKLFKTVKEASIYIGCSKSTVFKKLLPSSANKPYKNFLFKKGNDDTTWDIDEKMWRKPNTVKLRHPDGTIHEYRSAMQCAKSIGVEKYAVSRRLNGKVKNPIVKGYEVLRS